MASEKILVTATTDSDTNGLDTELQGHRGRSPPAGRDVLEVGALLYDPGDKTDSCAEVHQPVVGSLLRRHRARLMGIAGHKFPVRAAQRWAFGYGLRMHLGRLWRNCGRLLLCGNGRHVRNAMSANRSSHRH